jgi:hypothetical protein
MKKIFKFNFLLLLILCSNSNCQNNKNVKKSSDNSKELIFKEDKNMLNNVLEKQLKQGAKQYNAEAGVEIPKFKFTDSELEVTVSLVNDMLISNGYVSPNNEDFSKKTKEIFNRIIDYNTTKKYLYVNFFNKCDKNFSNEPNNGIEHFGLYIIKNKNFITEFYYVPELIDYLKEYPQISKIESNISKFSKDEKGNRITIELWKELEENKDESYNLNSNRKKNIQIIVARNMYLFNKSRAHFKWLILNDERFMSDLITVFSYMKDENLLKWFLDKKQYNSDNIQEIDKLLWHKNCDYKLVFHNEVLNFISKDNEKAKYFYSLLNESYLQEIIDKNTSLTFSEKAEIIARIHSFIYSNAKEYDIFNYMGRFAEFMDRDDVYSKEFKNKNYYNLPDFSKQWKQAKEDGNGIALPGEE